MRWRASCLAAERFFLKIYREEFFFLRCGVLQEGEKCCVISIITLFFKQLLVLDIIIE